MKKQIALALALALPLCMAAQKRQAKHADSLRVVALDEVNVLSTRAHHNTPVAHTNMGREAIKAVNVCQDLPYLLSLTPSVTTTSDAGIGVGYTTIRVRGVDPTRVNITANGIPINDSESSAVYWTNMPDFASSAKDIQIQRGAGTSTNGAGAFGATVNIQTEAPGLAPAFGIDATGGSYGTHKETLRFSSGLLHDHWAVQGRLSNIGSEGYIDRATSRLGSYFVQAAYYGKTSELKFITFNGKERTYHAWNYTSKYEQSLYGRSYNSCGEYYDEDGNRQYYKDQIDLYHQQHYQLHWNQLLADCLKMNVALHYTNGQGYYEQYKAGKKYYQYGLPDAPDGSAKGDLVNRKWMDNDFFGFVASVNYNKGPLTAVLGGGWNKYDGDHYGNVMWAKGLAFEPNYEYYRNNAVKHDGNIYLKANYVLPFGLNVFADLQYRHTGIHMHGATDDWDGNKNQVVFNEVNRYDFFNPKFGLSYTFARHHNIYASLAIAHKEPTRNDFEEHVGEKLKAERLTDWELGYKYSGTAFTAGLGLYMMRYADQFVLTGQLNEIGEPIATNSGKSYRMGIEMEAAWKPVDWFRWDINATLSRNRNQHWTVQAVSDNTNWTDQGAIDLGETPITFSPGFIANNIFAFNYKGFEASVMSQYVGKQYLTNTGFSYAQTDDGDVQLFLDKFFTTNIDLSYTFKPRFIQSARLGVTIYNVFSKKYDNNGWAYNEIGRRSDGSLYAWTTDLYESGFAPQAPCYAMAHVSIDF